MPKMYNEEGEVIYAGRGKRSRNARTLIAQRKAYIHNDEGQLVVYVPEDPGTSDPARALNMSFESRTDSLFHAANTGRVEIKSIVGDGYDACDAVRMDVHNPGPTAVRMVVPRGTMVEQQTWTGKQNLVVKEDVWIEIEPGQTGNFPLPAFCANSSGGSPSGEPMNLTPFVFNDMGESFRDQNSMWRTTDSNRSVNMR